MTPDVSFDNTISRKYLTEILHCIMSPILDSSTGGSKDNMKPDDTKLNDDPNLAIFTPEKNT